MSRDLQVRVWRGDAGSGRLVGYSVPVEDGEVVLDAVHRLQATQAGDLARALELQSG